MLILGHRGTGVTMRNTKAQEDARRKAGTRGPENTLKAFRLAFEGGAHGIELDVFLTADGDLAVIHDDLLKKHVRGAKGRVTGHTMAQLRRMDAGDGEPIPSLRDVFALAMRFNAPMLNIELVGPGAYGTAYKQAKQSGYPMERIVFSSFDYKHLEKLRALDPAIKIGLLFQPRGSAGSIVKPVFSERAANAAIKRIRPASLHPVIDEVTPSFIRFARARNLEIFAWTRAEPHPASGSPALAFARRHKNDPDIHLITDYPAEIRIALSNNI